MNSSGIPSDDAETTNAPKPRPRWRLPLRLAVVLAMVIAVGAVGVAVAYPSVAAVNCPACFGMTHAGDGVYVDDGMDADRRREVTGIVARAERRVFEFFGGQVSDPRVLVCGTAECYERIGGGRERGVAVMNTDLMLSPKGVNVEIASHELSHVELHARLADAVVPQWFDEGLAVAVSEDPRWIEPESEADRCVERPDGPLPRTLDDWLREAAADQGLYAQAACEVATWMDGAGGRTAARELVRELSHGAGFDDVYPDGT